MKIENSLSKKIKRVEDQNSYNLKVTAELVKTITLPEKIFSVKLSCASDNPPEKNQDYYIRIVSIMKKCVENPMGIKKIRSLYSRQKRNKVRPPTKFPATYYSIKVMLDLLNKEGLIIKDNKGYYTSPKGKDLLSSKL